MRFRCISSLSSLVAAQSRLTRSFETPLHLRCIHGRDVQILRWSPHDASLVVPTKFGPPATMVGSLIQNSHSRIRSFLHYLLILQIYHTRKADFHEHSDYTNLRKSVTALSTLLRAWAHYRVHNFHCMGYICLRNIAGVTRYMIIRCASLIVHRN